MGKKEELQWVLVFRKVFIMNTPGFVFPFYYVLLVLWVVETQDIRIKQCFNRMTRHNKKEQFCTC